jgi:hypothetical protein
MSADRSSRWRERATPYDSTPGSPAMSSRAPQRRQLCRLARADQIVAGLEVIWAMLDRAALWVASVHADLAANSADFMDRTCAALLPTVPRQMRSLTCLGRMSLDHQPTAMAAARAAFEAGLRLAWINTPHDQHDREIRVLCLHNDQAGWKSAVASDHDRSGEGGDRWRQAAQAQRARVSRELDRLGWSSGPLPRVAPVKAQLHEHYLERLYSGYRLASEYVHGGLSSALEAEKIGAENGPFLIYWPNDWYLAVSMSAWACRFLSHYAD